MVSRKEEQPYWVVTVSINYSDQTYWGAEVVKLPDPMTNIRGPYVQVQAEDEIGAFNVAQKTLQRLGFRLGA